MNLVLRRVLSRQTFQLCDRTRYKVPINWSHITSNNIVQQRYFSDDKVETRSLPQLMQFPPIIWPSFIKFIKNWLFANLIIRPYFEQDFSLYEFVEASKHAIEVVSDALRRSDFKALEGLVDKEAISALKTSISQLSMSQRQLLSVEKDDIFYAFPYQVGVMFDDADKRWVEITMCYHVLRGLKSMKDSNDMPPLSLGVHPEFQDKIYVLNYRFIREFTKGVEDSWWINIANHFQPHKLLMNKEQ